MTLLIICSAALAGVLLGTLSEIETRPLVAALGGSALATALAWRKTTWRLVGLACCALALGALRLTLAQPPDADPLANFADQTVLLHGHISTVPTRTERATRFVLAVDSMGAQDQRARVLVIAGAEYSRLTVGDRLTIKGRLTENAGVPSRVVLFPEITLERAADPTPLSLGADLRAWAVEAIQRQLPEPQASLAAGVLLGGSGRLSAEFRGQLQRSGLAHIVAIDGYKQVIVTAALSAASVHLLGKRLAAAPIVIGIVGYTLLTGARPSAIRAGLMVGSATVAGVLGRLPDPLTSLLLAAVTMVGFEPEIVLDIGFQLSFSATLGLILLWPRLRRLLHGVPPLLGEPAGITLTVTVATLPVTLYVFQSVSLISPLAHVVAMPLLPPVLLAAAVLPLTEHVPLLNQAVSWLAWLPTTALSETVRISGDLPGAALSTGRLPPLVAVALSGALLGWGVLELPEAGELRSRLSGVTSRHRRIVAALVMGLASLVGVVLALGLRADGELHVGVLRVAPGEAVLVRAPTGRTTLIASGRVNAQALASQVSEHLPLWEHGLAMVVLLDSTVEPRLKLLLERYPAERIVQAADERIELGGGAVLDVYVGRDAAVSFGDRWQPLIGQPPTPTQDELRSDQTTFAATPAGSDRG